MIMFCKTEVLHFFKNSKFNIYNFVIPPKNCLIHRNKHFNFKSFLIKFKLFQLLLLNKNGN